MTPSEVYKQALLQLQTYIDNNGKHHTAEREAVLDIICHLKSPFTVGEVQKAASEMGISRGTVYNSMHVFTEAKLVHCLNRQYGQNRDQYELMLKGNNHMQVICLRCGRVSEFREVAIPNIAMARKYYNFIPQHVSVYVYGMCKSCRSIQGKGGDGRNEI